MAQFIVKTPSSGLDFLGVAGVQVIANHRQLRQMLTSRFGPAHAALLAEPKRDGSGGPIDWYSTRSGPPREIRKLTALSAADQAIHRDRLAVLIADIQDLAARLSESPRPDDKQLGRRLEAAATYPSDEFIYLDGDDVILVCWGSRVEHADRSATTLAKPIDEAARRSRAAAASAQEAVATPAAGTAGSAAGAAASVARTTVLTPVVVTSSQGWLTLLALLLLITFMTLLTRQLVPACGITMGGGLGNLGWCDAALLPPARAAVAEAMPDPETAKLEAELAALERRIAGRPCPVDRAQAQPQRPDDAGNLPTQADMQRRLDTQQAKTGEITASLFWNGPADLDLVMTCPGGRVSFTTPRGCGGELDVDMNYQNRRSNEPVENISIPQGAGPRGRYEVGVRNSTRDSGNVAFRVVIKVKGSTREVSGTVAASEETKAVASFEVD